MAVSNITSTTCRPEPLLPPSAVFEHFSDRATQITGRMPDNSMAPKIEEGDLLEMIVRQEGLTDLREQIKAWRPKGKREGDGKG